MTSDPRNHKKKSAINHPMVVLQPGERIIAEIKRHPFGILSVYGAALVALVIAGSLAVAAPSYFDSYAFDGNAATYVAAAVILFMVLMGLILVVATIVYWQNRWVVTDDSITQISQDSLFGRRVSQLSMENLEDVTVDQHGIFPTLFNYGTLKAETAGEHSKFTFPYCPQPNKYARLILEVHETFLHQRRHQPQAVHPVTPLNGPHTNQPYAQQYTAQQNPQQGAQNQTQQQWSPQPQQQIYQDSRQVAQPQQPMQQYAQPQYESQGLQDQAQQPQNRNTTLPPPLQ